MKAVMLSIQPKWCELIASGKKTVEVRRTKPKIDVPFKCYIYETQGRTETPFVDEEGHHIFKGRGQVIGEFVCDKIVEFENSWYDPAFAETSELSCVGWEELALYLGGKEIGYGWHISDLVIYDKPKELSEFRSYNVSTYIDEEFGLPMPTHIIKRPFQSWGYVDELKGETE